MGKVLIVGSGFAGLWAALGAARRIDELGLPPDSVEITVLSRTGWDRTVSSTGVATKATKTIINTERIYPPLTGDRAALLAAAAPEVQTPPITG